MPMGHIKILIKIFVGLLQTVKTAMFRLFRVYMAYNIATPKILY